MLLKPKNFYEGRKMEYDKTTIVPTPGDRGVLEMMNHKHSAIYSSTGRKYIFAVRAEDDIGRKD